MTNFFFFFFLCFITSLLSCPGGEVSLAGTTSSGVTANIVLRTAPTSTPTTTFSFFASAAHPSLHLSGSFTMQAATTATFSGLTSTQFDESVSIAAGCSLSLTGISSLDGPAQQFHVGGNMTVGTHSGDATVLYVDKVALNVSGILTVDTQATINGGGNGYASNAGPGAGASCSGTCMHRVCVIVHID